MIAFNCLLIFGLYVHLVSSDVSLTIGSNRPNVKTDQSVRSNYEAPRGYEYSGSYSTVAPERNGQYVDSSNKGQYVGSFSTGAPEIKYIGSTYSYGESENNAQYVNAYSTAAPDSRAQYVGSYSTVAPDSKAQYVSSYSTVAPKSKSQYVGSYSTVAPDSKAQYVGSYSTAAPDTKAQYVSSYSTGAPDNKAQYVGSYSTAAPDTKAQYVSSYSTGAPDNKAQYVGSYSTAAPDTKAQYVSSYSTAAPDNKAQYVSSYSTGAPDNKAQYVNSYSTVAPDNKAQYVSSYSTGAPDNKAQYVNSYSTGAPDTKAQYVSSYSTGAPDNKAQYVSSYSTGAPDNKAQYVNSYSTVAPDNKAQYVSSYSTGAPDTKAQYVSSYSTGAPDNKAQYVGSYSSATPDSKAQYVGSYSSAVPENKAQYVGSYSAVTPSNNKAQYVGSYSEAAPDSKAQYVGSYSARVPENKAQYSSSSSSSSYNSYPSGQIASDRGYYSAKQEYNPQYQNDRGVLLISKELQVPFGSSKKSENSEGCDETKDRNVNQVQSSDQTFVQSSGQELVPGSVQSSVQSDSDSNEYDKNNESQGNENLNNENQETQYDGNVEQNVPVAPVYKTSKYEVRRPGIRKEFYDIEEKVFIKPAGTAIFELEHDKPHSSAIVNQHIAQQQSSAEYPQYSDDNSQYYPEEQQFANHGYGHGYHPVFLQPPQYPPHHFTPAQPPPTHPHTHHYNPVYPSTTITPGYVPPVGSGYLPPCEDVPSVPSKPSKPHPPSSHHELSDEYDENDHHDYDADAGYITPINEESQDIKYATSKSTPNREREYYRASQPSGYNSDSRIDRLRVEYRNQRGDLAQLKANQYPEQFYHEYVPNVNVDQSKVQIRPNGDAPAKYSQPKVSSQVEIENSQRLLDLYSANGDVTEVGFGGGSKTQQYKEPNKNVPARVVSVTPAPQYANYVDEQTKSRRVALTQPLYTVQQVEVREHNHRLVEDVQHDGVAPSVNAFEKLRLIGGSFGKSSSSSRSADVNSEAEYVTPVPEEYGNLRAASPVPDNLQY